MVTFAAHPSGRIRRFHRWVERGVYEPNWGCGRGTPKSVDNVSEMGE